MDKTEDLFYAMAAQEAASKTFTPDLMAKATVGADGDEKKTMLNYIELRVAQLSDKYLEILPALACDLSLYAIALAHE